MTRLNTIIAIVFVALWVPITMHCKLESIPGLELLRCVSDSPSSPDCDGDSCQAVESGWYKIEDNQAFVSAALGALVFPQAILRLQHPLTEESVVVTLTPAPPELLNTWQFCYRAAAPPRAPSLVS